MLRHSSHQVLRVGFDDDLCHSLGICDDSDAFVAGGLQKLNFGQCLDACVKLGRLARVDKLCDCAVEVVGREKGKVDPVRGLGVTREGISTVHGTSGYNDAIRMPSIDVLGAGHMDEAACVEVPVAFPQFRMNLGVWSPYPVGIKLPAKALIVGLYRQSKLD